MPCDQFMRQTFAASLIAAGLLALSAPPGAMAKSKLEGSCPVKGGRAPCDWVQDCLLDGGEPQRQPFTGKLLCCFSDRYCEGVPEPAAKGGTQIAPGGKQQQRQGPALKLKKLQ